MMKQKYYINVYSRIQNLTESRASGRIPAYEIDEMKPIDVLKLYIESGCFGNLRATDVQNIVSYL